MALLDIDWLIDNSGIQASVLNGLSSSEKLEHIYFKHQFPMVQKVENIFNS